MKEKWLLILLILGVLGIIVTILLVIMRIFNRRINMREHMWKHTALEHELSYTLCPGDESPFHDISGRGRFGVIHEVIEHRVLDQVAGFTFLVENLAFAQSDLSTRGHQVVERGAISGPMIGLNDEFSVRKKGFLSSFGSDYKLGDEVFDKLFQVQCKGCEEAATRLLNNDVRKALLDLSRLVPGVRLFSKGVVWESYTPFQDPNTISQIFQAMKNLALALRASNQGGPSAWEADFEAREDFEVPAEAESAILV